MNRACLFLLTIFCFFCQTVSASSLITKELKLPEIAGYYIPKEISQHIFNIMVEAIQHPNTIEECKNKSHDLRFALDMRSISQNWNNALLDSRMFAILFDSVVIFDIKNRNTSSQSLFLKDKLCERYHNRYCRLLLPYVTIFSDKIEEVCYQKYRFRRCLQQMSFVNLFAQCGVKRSKKRLLFYISTSLNTELNTGDKKKLNEFLTYNDFGRVPVKIIFQNGCEIDYIKDIYQIFIDNNVCPCALNLPMLTNIMSEAKNRIQSLFDVLFQRKKLQYVFCSYDNAPIFSAYVQEKYQKYVRYYNTNANQLRTLLRTLLRKNVLLTMKDIAIIAKKAAENGDSDLFFSTFLSCIANRLISDLDFSHDVVGDFIRSGITIRPIMTNGHHVITKCCLYPALVRNLLEYGLKIDQPMIHGTQFTLIEYILDDIAMSYKNPFYYTAFFDAISTINILLEHDVPYKKDNIIKFTKILLGYYQSWLNENNGYSLKSNTSIHGLTPYDKMLFIIVQKGHVLLLPLLLRCGANINTKNQFKRTVGHYAKSKLDFQYLVQHGFDINKFKKDTRRKNDLIAYLHKKNNNIRPSEKNNLLRYIKQILE